MSEVYANRWARHYQDEWAARAGDPRLPGWLRLSAYAYSAHAANGHVPLTRSSRYGAGTLALVLTTVHPDGSHVQPPRQRVHEWLRQAVDFGWLDKRSTTTCLIVPEQAVTGGLGAPSTPCKVCDKPRRHVARSRTAARATVTQIP